MESSHPPLNAPLQKIESLLPIERLAMKAVPCGVRVLEVKPVKLSELPTKIRKEMKKWPSSYLREQQSSLKGKKRRSLCPSEPEVLKRIINQLPTGARGQRWWWTAVRNLISPYDPIERGFYNAENFLYHSIVDAYDRSEKICREILKLPQANKRLRKYLEEYLKLEKKIAALPCNEKSREAIAKDRKSLATEYIDTRGAIKGREKLRKGIFLYVLKIRTSIRLLKDNKHQYLLAVHNFGYRVLADIASSLFSETYPDHVKKILDPESFLNGIFFEFERKNNKYQ